jgi:hypothetical protein
LKIFVSDYNAETECKPTHFSGIAKMPVDISFASSFFYYMIQAKFAEKSNNDRI